MCHFRVYENTYILVFRTFVIVSRSSPTQKSLSNVNNVYLLDCLVPHSATRTSPWDNSLWINVHSVQRLLFSHRGTNIRLVTHSYLNLKVLRTPTTLSIPYPSSLRPYTYIYVHISDGCSWLLLCGHSPQSNHFYVNADQRPAAQMDSNACERVFRCIRRICIFGQRVPL